MTTRSSLCANCGHMAIFHDHPNQPMTTLGPLCGGCTGPMYCMNFMSDAIADADALRAEYGGATECVGLWRDGGTCRDEREDREGMLCSYCLTQAYAAAEAG